MNFNFVQIADTTTAAGWAPVRRDTNTSVGDVVGITTTTGTTMGYVHSINYNGSSTAGDWTINGTTTITHNTAIDNGIIEHAVQEHLVTDIDIYYKNLKIGEGKVTTMDLSRERRSAPTYMLGNVNPRSFSRGLQDYVGSFTLTDFDTTAVKYIKLGDKFNIRFYVNNTTRLYGGSLVTVIDAQDMPEATITDDANFPLSLAPLVVGGKYLIRSNYILTVAETNKEYKYEGKDSILTWSTEDIESVLQELNK